MKELEERIRKDGRVLPGGILKVDAFMNVQIDPVLLDHMGEEFARLFKEAGVTKILTIEASGIAPASSTAMKMGVPFVFAKKAKSSNVSGEDMYTSKVRSFTYGRDYDILVPAAFIQPDDCVLIIDDFLANGFAARGLIQIAEQAGAQVAGIGVCVAKLFQPGYRLLKDQGIRVEALAPIQAMDDNSVIFADE